MVLAAAFWGLGTIATKAVLDEVPPLTLLVVQLTVSVLFLWLIFLATRQTFSLGKNPARLSLAGLLNPGLAYTFALIGLSITTASMSSLLWAAEPALILALAWILLKERLTGITLLLSLVAISGALMVIAGAANLEGGGLLLGNLFIVAAVFFCSFYTVITKQAAENANPISLAAVQLSVSLVLALAIWSVDLNDGVLAILADIQPHTWFWASVSGIIYYALAFLFYIMGLKQMAASEAALYLNLIPIFGVAGAFIFLGERLAPIQWIGALVILFAVGAISILQKKGAVLQGSDEQRLPEVELRPGGWRRPKRIQEKVSGKIRSI